MKIMTLHRVCLGAVLALTATALTINTAPGAVSPSVDYSDARSAKILAKSDPPQDQVVSNDYYPPNQAPAKDPEYGVLKGSGGGVDVLAYKKDEHEEKFVYRPWKTRFDLQPYDLNSPDFLKPENRMGYRQFYAANPNLALAPNSRDRTAQSTVELIFSLTALASIVCGVFIIHKMSVLDTENLTLIQYQDLMMRVVILAALPWFALGVWLFTVFGAGVINPMRDPSMVYAWQCSAMAWFLVAASAVNTLYFASHALWISRLFFKLEREISFPMGQMFALTSEMQKLASCDRMTGIINLCTDPTIRHMLLWMEALCAVFGYMLITFRGGANSQFCHPEVYWATTALVATVAIIIVFTFLTFVFSVLIGVYLVSPWVQDFVQSFKDARVMKKMTRMEEEEKAFEAFLKKKDAEVNYEDEFNAWRADLDIEKEEACRLHHESKELTIRYEAEVSRAPPWQIDPATASMFSPPTSMTPSALAGAPPSNLTAFGPPATSFSGNASAMNFMAGGSYVGSLDGESPESPWSGEGFSKPFGQR